MDTQCNATTLGFPMLGRRQIVADFDGGDIASDGGALLLRKTEQLTGIIRQFAACFTDHRNPDLIEHPLADPWPAGSTPWPWATRTSTTTTTSDVTPSWPPQSASSTPRARRQRVRDRGKPLAGKSTLNRLELTPVARQG